MAGAVRISLQMAVGVGWSAVSGFQLPYYILYGHEGMPGRRVNHFAHAAPFLLKFEQKTLLRAAEMSSECAL